VKVLVDTDVWSEAFRSRAVPSPHVKELRRLIGEGRVQMIGILRMEILSGIRDVVVFETLRERLAAFPDRPLDTEVFETAARFLNQCRSKGIQGSYNDFVLCGCSVLWDIPILSKDQDYAQYRKVLPIRLAQPRLVEGD
jgi:predicted nucleic acid-binding protein